MTRGAGSHVDPSQWNLGELLAFVPERVEDFRPGDRRWRKVMVDSASPASGAASPLSVVMAALSSVGKKSDPEVSLLSIASARDLQSKGLLFFPNGGPSPHQLYARHPLRLRDYIPYAAYHREIVHERSIEMARYLLSLGATEVRIAWQQQIGKGSKIRASLDTPTPDEVAAELGMARDRGGDLSIQIFGSGKNPPQPTDLIWPRADPVFKLAHDAATGTTFHFGMKGRQSSSVSAEAGARLEKQLGFHLGGEYKRWEDLTFTVDASFRQGG
jgi:hypothetical protein